MIKKISTILLIFMFIFIIWAVWLSLSIALKKRSITQLNLELDQAQTKLQELRSDISSLSNKDYLTDLAEKYLPMFFEYSSSDINRVAIFEKLPSKLEYK